ncbi:unnamed protein product, partial [Symbiodinium sp. KB8]
AEEVILCLDDNDVEEAEQVSLATKDDIERWKGYLKDNDPEHAMVSHKQRNGQYKNVSLRTLMGTKISEHWSYKSKSLIRTLGTEEHLKREHLYRGEIIRNIAEWLGVEIDLLKPEAVVLAFWRVNKRCDGATLRMELTKARTRVRGGGRGGHRVARKQWDKELKATWDELFPDDDYSALWSGKDAARK